MVGNGVPQFLLKKSAVQKPAFSIRPMRDESSMSYSKREDLMHAIKNQNMLPKDWRIDFRKT
jgi:hypothetical protein